MSDDIDRLLQDQMGVPETTIQRVAMHRKPSPLSPKDHQAIIAEATRRFFDTTLPFSKQDFSLGQAPQMHRHRARIEALLVPYLEAWVDDTLHLVQPAKRNVGGVEIMTSAALEEAFQYREDAAEALIGYVRRHWAALWRGSNRGAPSLDSIEADLEGLAQDGIFYQIYPPFEIPATVKDDMIERAIKQATHFKVGDTPFRNTPFYRDELNQAMIRDALRFDGERTLQYSEKRRPMPGGGYMTERFRPSYAEQREHHQALLKSLGSQRDGPDIYDVCARLEETFGTKATDEIGSKLHTRFLDSLEKHIQAFREAHHLDEPYYHKGQQIQL